MNAQRLCDEFGDMVFIDGLGAWKVYLNGQVLPQTWTTKGDAEISLAIERRRLEARQQRQLTPRA